MDEINCKKYLNQNKLQRLTRSRKRSHPCATCKHCFRDGYQLKQHAEIRNCKRCHVPFKCAKALRDHVARCNRMTHFTCMHCTKTFSRADVFWKHVEVQQDEEQELCVQCNQRFRRPCIYRHKKANKCSACAVEFTCLTMLRDHVSQCNRVIGHSCRICGQGFRLPHLLQKHVRAHEGVKSYICSHCGQQFKSSYMLNQHIQMQFKAEMFSCSQCDAKFSRRSKLTSHIRTHSAKHIDDIITSVARGGNNSGDEIKLDVDGLVDGTIATKVEDEPTRAKENVNSKEAPPQLNIINVRSLATEWRSSHDSLPELDDVFDGRRELPEASDSEQRSVSPPLEQQSLARDSAYSNLLTVEADKQLTELPMVMLNRIDLSRCQRSCRARNPMPVEKVPGLEKLGSFYLARYLDL